MSTLNVNCTRSVMFNWLVLHYPNMVTFWLKVAFIIWLALNVFPHPPTPLINFTPGILALSRFTMSSDIFAFSHALPDTFQVYIWHPFEMISFIGTIGRVPFSAGTRAIPGNPFVGTLLFTMLPQGYIPLWIFVLDWCPGLWTGFCYDDISPFLAATGAPIYFGYPGLHYDSASQLHCNMADFVHCVSQCSIPSFHFSVQISLRGCWFHWSWESNFKDDKQ